MQSQFKPTSPTFHEKFTTFVFASYARSWNLWQKIRAFIAAMKFYAQALKQLLTFRDDDDEIAASARARIALDIPLRSLVSQFRYDYEQAKSVIVPRGIGSEQEYIDRTLRFMTSASVEGKTLGYDFPLVQGEIDILVSYPGKDAFFGKLEEDLRQAKDHIHIAMYGIWDKHEGKIAVAPSESLAARILRLLKRKAEEGVKVKLILDSFGSRLEGPRQDKGHTPILRTDILEHPNIIVAYNESWETADLERFFKLDHRKLYLIDGSVAYVGGMGIENKFDNSFEDSAAHDIMVRMRGRIVYQFQSAFLDSFCYQLSKSKNRNRITPRTVFAQESEELRKRYFPDSVHRVKADTRAKCIMNVPVCYFYGYTEEYARMIADAKQCLYLTNSSYNDDKLTKFLRPTAQRLCKEDYVWQKGLSQGRGALLILPGKKRMKFIDEVIYLTDIMDAIKNKITVLRYEAGWLHAKVMMQDNARVIIGSCNLDYFSPNRNWEVGVLLEGESPVQEAMREIFLFDEPPRSKELTLKEIPFRKRLVCNLFDLLPWF
jgi:phosphatidylserine/phosphatidylglycerophosphate/cardiolipin synthase-like enzyme